MNIFISWSGTRSKQIANLFRDNLKYFIQSVVPWVSTQDIEKGTLWMSQISKSLKGSNIGIICVTLENKEQPWLLFEAGALNKGLSKSRVCPFLIDLKPTDLLNNP